VSTRCRLGLLTLTTVGALALLVAFGIVLLMRLNKNRFTKKRRYSRNWPSESSSQNSYGAAMGSSVYESAYGNPFLTESEKAFVAQLETTIDKHDVSISETHWYYCHIQVLTFYPVVNEKQCIPLHKNTLSTSILKS
jgi:hypothetical protein